MGRYTFFNNYLLNSVLPGDLLVLREMKHLDCDEDHKVLLPVLFYLGDREGTLTGRNTHFSLARDRVFRLIELTLLVSKPRINTYNIYECCFLAFRTAIGDPAKDKTKLLVETAFCLIVQIVLLAILLDYNKSAIINRVSWSTDSYTIIVVVITTLFFIKLVYAHGRKASDFNALFLKAGFSSSRAPNTIGDKVKKQLHSTLLAIIAIIGRGLSMLFVPFIILFLLISKVSERVHECYRGKESVLEKELRKALLGINILVNWGLGIVIVLFNIFFLLNSNDVNEAILNSVALFFILEIDEELKPDWDEVHFDRRVGENLFRCDDGHYDGVQVDVKSSMSPQDCLHLLERDNRVDYEAKEEGDQLVINVYASEDCIRIKFCISGENGRDFLI
ncbi:hypothetical protein ACHAXM_003342 [Skeletonema potamos]